MCLLNILYDATDRASLNAIDRFESNVRVFAKIIGLTCILFFPSGNDR